MASVIVGVTGGVAAYKAALLVRLFTESGHDVTVIPTDAALQFVGRPTWEALSGNPVQTGVFDHVDQVKHVALGQQADLVVVAPATANTLAKAAHGLADDLLTNTLLTARCPVVFAPAMHTEMWAHPATIANVAQLRSRGVRVIEPAHGRLTGSDTGPGRLPDPEVIFGAAVAHLHRDTHDLAGKTLLISAGGTREPLDPVRFLANRSSGQQGFALAEAAAARGARVILVSAVPDRAAPADVEMISVDTTRQMHEAVLTHAQEASAIIMAAAPADFRAADESPSKIKKTHDGQAPTIALTENPDILVDLVARRHQGQLIVGFAAETGDDSASVMDHAQAKLERKGCDLLLVNDVSGDKVFGKDTTTLHVLGPTGSIGEPLTGDKTIVSAQVLDHVATLLGSTT